MSTPFEATLWSGFYKKTLKERQSLVQMMYPNLFERRKSRVLKSVVFDSGSFDASKARDTSEVESTTTFPFQGLSDNVADIMVENCIGSVGIPVGLAMNFIVDSDSLVIPMAIEEPSVVAAVSGAAKTICSLTAEHGGIKTCSAENNQVTAQITLHGVTAETMAHITEKINCEKQALITLGNTFCQSMVERGGGVRDIQVRTIQKNNERKDHHQALFPSLFSPVLLVVHVDIDVGEAMGANIASTVAEGLAPHIAELTKTRAGICIISNLCKSRVTKATFRVPVDKLGYKNLQGLELASRIVEAAEWAFADPYRGATHNKGIMNGIDAVGLACGQDFRALEAGAHCWASCSSESTRYKPFTEYWLEKEEGTNDGTVYLVGEIVIPLMVGTRGGVIRTNPTYTYSLGLLHNPSSARLSQIMAAVGLMQNFAALRALVSEGIQRGHMTLHAHNIALAAGAPVSNIHEVTNYMVEINRVSIAAAREYITAHRLGMRLMKQLNPESSESLNQKLPSMFYFEEKNKTPGKNLKNQDNLFFNVAFNTYGGNEPILLEFSSTSKPSRLQHILFGDKTYDWVMKLISHIDQHQLHPLNETCTMRQNELECRKLKCLSILLNVVTWRLSSLCPELTFKLMSKLFKGMSLNQLGQLNNVELEEPCGRPVDEEETHFHLSDINLNFKLPEPLEPSSGKGIQWGKAIWSLPDMTLFEGESLLDGFSEEEYLSYSMEALSETSKTDEDTNVVINVGFPLMIALWQIFEIRVVQWIGHPQLASVLLQEQRRVLFFTMRSLKEHSHFSERNRELETTSLQMFMYHFFKHHQKRFQLTMMMLIDLHRFVDEVITQELLEQLFLIGFYLEHETIMAHDISRAKMVGPRLAHYPVQSLGDIDPYEGSLDTLYPALRYDSNSLIQWKKELSKHPLETIHIEPLIHMDQFEEWFSHFAKQFIQYNSLKTIRKCIDSLPKLDISFSKCLEMAEHSREYYGVSKYYE